LKGTFENIKKSLTHNCNTSIIYTTHQFGTLIVISIYNKVYFIYKWLDLAEIRWTLGGPECALKNEWNFEFWIALESHWSLFYHLHKHSYVIENHTKSLMFSIHYVLFSVANICEIQLVFNDTYKKLTFTIALEILISIPLELLVWFLACSSPKCKNYLTILPRFPMKW